VADFANRKEPLGGFDIHKFAGYTVLRQFLKAFEFDNLPGDS